MQNIITTREPINRFPYSQVHSMGISKFLVLLIIFSASFFFQILDHLRGFVILEKMKQNFCPHILK